MYARIVASESVIKTPAASPRKRRLPIQQWVLRVEDHRHIHDARVVLASRVVSEVGSACQGDDGAASRQVDRV